jgi:hypothetical protein
MAKQEEGPLKGGILADEVCVIGVVILKIPDECLRRWASEKQCVPTDFTLPLPP